MDLLTICPTPRGDTVRIGLRGEIDLTTCPALEQAISAAVAQASAVELDLSGVEFIGSEGVRVLLRGLREAEAKSVGFVLVDPSSMVRRVLDVLGLTGTFEVEARLAESVAGDPERVQNRH
ncbi:MAG TPA: STAS domain-containing protein [Acidimicrobiales bacterium]|nr:STAS domain-containing protein [Acidimicrobiales bacterium]